MTPWVVFSESVEGKKLIAEAGQCQGHLVALSFAAGLMANYGRCPDTNLQIGEWFSNREFYCYKGKLPIVVESEHALPGRLAVKTYNALFGCISCQLPKIRQSGTPKRWMILPL